MLDVTKFKRDYSFFLERIFATLKAVTHTDGEGLAALSTFQAATG